MIDSTCSTDLLNLPQMENLPTDSESLQRSFRRYLTHHLGHFLGCKNEFLYDALSLTIRDRLMSQWRNTWSEHRESGIKRGHYLSLEFLIGRSLGNNLLNLGIRSQTEEAMNAYCMELETILQTEPDAGLGNGGLGRLAACFMESCATLQLPVMGYGIRYEYGMFNQHIENGRQVEAPDHWLRDGNPWELERQEFSQRIHFGGRCSHYMDQDGIPRTRWEDTEQVLAIPYDIPITGYANGTVNTLRLWKATATDEFNLNEFNAGSYTEAVAEKNNAEQITMVLYPNDSSENGKELRLRQQYFLASASLQDIFQQWEHIEGEDYSNFAQQNVFQMNDTHPSIAVAELMRILLDEKHLQWEPAWEICRHTMAYTNHTLLPEALETWSVELFERLLPRLLEIIYQINARFLHDVSLKWPGDQQRQRRMSIINEDGQRSVRMAYLAIVGSFSVNGVAELHSKLLTQHLFNDFYEMWPEKFNNKTNGVTPRRWIAHANPAMSELISTAINGDWITDLSHIAKLKPLAEAEHSEFHQLWFETKRQNKQRLAELVKQRCNIDFSVDALFDVQVKRIHEYKRQLLNLLHVIHLYSQIKKGNISGHVNRCILIGGKAAPGYVMAKNIIKLINNVADIVNDDSDIGDQLKVAFLPGYDVSSMEIIAPATDLSEQISTAGKEASGTGNMKFMMNGALTIGTYDGANIEILNAVGEENFFLFGLKEEELQKLRPHYDPQSIIDNDPDLKEVMRLLELSHFNQCEPGIFDDIINSLKDPNDPWFTLADFRSYINAQQEVATAYKNRQQWTRMSILNTAASGFFSTDRTISDYNADIWKLEPLRLQEHQG